MITQILRPVANCLILLMIEVTISPWIIIQGWSPDLLLIYVLIYTAKNGKNAGLLVGLFAGLLQDITGGASLGLLGLAKSNLGFWFGFWLERKGVSLSAWRMSMILLISTVLQNAWEALFTLQGSEIGFGSHIFGDVLPTAVYTAFMAYIFAIITGIKSINLKKSSVLR